MAQGSVSITLSGPALAKLKALASKTEKQAAMRVAGTAAVQVYKSHFRALNAKHPNKLGGERTNFWSAVAQSTNLGKVTTTRAEIGIAHPAIAQKVYGGVITAKRSKYLTIPIDPLAHGKRAQTIGFPLALRAMGGGKGLLLVRKSDGAPMFVLKRSVTQAPQKDALPDIKQTVAPAVVRAIQGYLEE